MILVLLGGGCLRDLDHPHPKPVQVVVDALQKLQHLRPLFLPMFICTSFLLANISLCISFRICLSAPLFCQILYFNAFFVIKCLSAPGLFEKSVLTAVVLLHKRPFKPTIPASMYSMIKWKKCLSCPTVHSMKACTYAWWLSLPERNTKVQLICLFQEKFFFRIDMKHFLKCLQTLFMKICLQTPD